MSENIKEIINDLQRVADRKCYPEDILCGSIAQEWADYITDLYEENERLNNIIKTKDEGFKASIEELTDYANRIDKALEYIKEYLYINEETGEYCLTHTFDSSNLYELMKILKEYRV